MPYRHRCHICGLLTDVGLSDTDCPADICCCGAVLQADGRQPSPAFVLPPRARASSAGEEDGMDVDQPNGDAVAVKAEEDDDDDVDPLDAFMAAEVLPEMAKVQKEQRQQKWGVPQQQEQQQQEVKQEEDAGGTADGIIVSQPAGGSGRPPRPPAADDRKKKAAAARKRVSRYYDSENSSDSDEVRGAATKTMGP